MAVHIQMGQGGMARAHLPNGNGHVEWLGNGLERAVFKGKGTPDQMLGIKVIPMVVGDEQIAHLDLFVLKHLIHLRRLMFLAQKKE